MPKNSTRYRDRRDIPQNTDEQDPRIRYAVDFFGNRDNVNYKNGIFGNKYPDAYFFEESTKEFPMHFAVNSPEMEAMNSLVQYLKPNSGLVFRESYNPIADRDRIAGNPSRVVTYNSRSSRGAGTRKRLYKNEDEENDPRKRGKKFIENIKSGLSSAYNFVANPIKEVATNAPRQAREIYERGKSGGERVRFQGKDPLSRFAQRGVDSIYDAGKVVRSAENSAENTRRKVDFANRAIRETPRVISDMYEGGRTGKKARTNALGEDLIRNIAGIHGFIQGVNEGIRGSGEKGNTKKRATAPKMAKKSSTPEYINYIYGSRPPSPQPITNYPRPTPNAKPPQPTPAPHPIPVYNQKPAYDSKPIYNPKSVYNEKMGKRATAPKMARKTTAASSRQAGFVNGRPVSLKKRANTSMKYFK